MIYRLSVRDHWGSYLLQLHFRVLQVGRNKDWSIQWLMGNKRTKIKREVSVFSSFCLSLSILSVYPAAESTESLVRTEHCF